MRAEPYRPDTTSAGLNALSDLINDDWGDTSYRAPVDTASKADFVEQFARNVSISSRDLRARRDDGYTGSKARPLEKRKGSPLQSRVSAPARALANVLARTISANRSIPSGVLTEPLSGRQQAPKAASRSVSQAKPSPSKERVSKARPSENCQPRPEKKTRGSGKSGPKPDFIPWCDRGKR